MEVQENLSLNPGSPRPNFERNFITNDNIYVINQYKDKICTEYYKEHFSEIVSFLNENNYKIDAFSDYGHSCATLRGFVDADLVDWKFIMTSINYEIIANKDKAMTRFRNHSKEISDRLEMEFAGFVDTFPLGEKIENTFPDFGNIYEATRSISGAMNYLSKNPNKTVLVYVGDAPEKEGTKFRGNSRSRTGSLELNILFSCWNKWKEHKKLDYNQIITYFNTLMENNKEMQSYYLTNIVRLLYTFVRNFPGHLENHELEAVLKNIKKINSLFSDNVLEMIRLINEGKEKNKEKICEIYDKELASGQSNKLFLAYLNGDYNRTNIKPIDDEDFVELVKSLQRSGVLT